VVQVAGEPVAEVYHGVDVEVLGQPARFGEAGFEVEMVPLDGTSQFTGDEDRVAHLRARPEDGASGGHGAPQGNIEE
jgi:hypothetical protein